MSNKRRNLLIATLMTAALFSTTGGCGKDASDDRSSKPQEKAARVKQVPEIPPSEPGDIAAGKLVYEKHCHYCHGLKGRGKGAVSIAVEPNPADFISDKKRMAVTDEALYKSLSYGITKESGGQKLEKALAMPPFMGVLTPKERWDVVAYLRELVREAQSQENKK